MIRALFTRIRWAFRSQDSKRKALYEQRLRESLTDDFRWDQ